MPLEACGKLFFNQMKNDSTLTQHINENQPRVTTVAVPQTISFRKKMRKCMAKNSSTDIDSEIVSSSCLPNDL